MINSATTFLWLLLLRERILHHRIKLTYTIRYVRFYSNEQVASWICFFFFSFRLANYLWSSVLVTCFFYIFVFFMFPFFHLTLVIFIFFLFFSWFKFFISCFFIFLQMFHYLNASAATVSYPPSALSRSTNPDTCYWKTKKKLSKDNYWVISSINFRILHNKIKKKNWIIILWKFFFFVF